MSDYDALRKAAEGATPGPWEWEPPSTESWPQADESLIAVRDEWRVCPYFCGWPKGDAMHRGEPGSPGHEHRVTEPVVSGWGYDASGTDATDEDRCYIAAASPDVVLALLDELDEVRGQLDRTEVQIHEPGGFIDRVSDQDEEISELRAKVARVREVIDSQSRRVDLRTRVRAALDGSREKA